MFIIYVKLSFLRVSGSQCMFKISAVDINKHACFELRTSSFFDNFLLSSFAFGDELRKMLK